MNPAASASASPASYYEEDVLYEVESIKDMVILDSGQKLFLIKWKNYDDSENTWEPEENLNCPDLLEQFLAQHAAQSRSRKRSPSASKRRRSTTQPATSQPAKRAVAETLTEKTTSEEISAHDSKRARKEASSKPSSTRKKASVDKDKQSKDKAPANTLDAASSTQQQQQHSSLSMSPNVQLQTDIIQPLYSERIPSSNQQRTHH
ncbi:predicted protein [Lichtheimia corymbifera JMRC:FSU:9682]|uniref:Chromo domain-containing protein n=1 Tax=Lichtheimia corymbifera JMRC:FSU:9682 TaxID=1263082 RepID=A0A068RYQ8_9FUNG|nr:predicted protein [Lichtheimia corymbifera JMRC:FSU:9682]